MDWTEVKKMLKLLQYQDNEIDEQKDRVLRALKRGRLNDENILSAQKNIEQDFDLISARQIWGLWFRRFVDLMLCDELGKKIVYHVHPGIPRLHLAMTQIYKDQLYSDFPDTIIMFNYGRLFDKVARIIEKAEELGLEQTQAQCAINQVNYAVVVDDLAPKPDLIVCGRYQCDQSVKLCELISEMKDIPFITYDTVRDEPWGFFPKVEQRAVKYFAREYGNALEEACEVLEIDPLPEEGWKKTRKDYVLPWILLNDIHELYINTNPRPAKLKNHVGFPFSVLEPHGDYYQMLLGALQLNLRELRERKKAGYGVLPKDAPKVGLMCGVSVGQHDDADMYEEAGLNVVIPIGAVWMAPYERGSKEATTHLERIAWSYLCKGYVRASYDHTYRFRVMAEHAKLDGVVYAVQFSCRVLAPAGYMVKKEVEEKMGVPTMFLEMDGVDPRTHTTESLRTRVEAFAELLKSRKTMAA